MRKLLLVLTALITSAAVAFYGYIEGVHIDRLSPAELDDMLSSYYEFYVPDGSAPHPTVVGFHGCSGTLHGARDWARLLQQAGFAVVLVESIAPRELDWPDVCSGRALWGSERAGDVMVSLDAVRQLPFVDADNLHLFGWSHGGWALMDAFAYAASRKRPPNLTVLPARPLHGVRSATLFYPFCEFPVRARQGWPQSFPVHFIFAESDSIVSNAACELIAEAQRASGKPVSARTYPRTDHAFDMRDEDFYDGTLGNQPDATRQVHADMLNHLSRWSR